LTELDVRLFTTIIRFDAVYVQHFKCNIRDIRSGYPNLHKYVQSCQQYREIILTHFFPGGCATCTGTMMPSRAPPNSLTSSATTQSRTSKSTRTRSRQLVRCLTFCLSIRTFLPLLLPFVRRSSKGFIDWASILLYASILYSLPTQDRESTSYEPIIS
jgi:hypothetical protein